MSRPRLRAAEDAPQSASRLSDVGCVEPTMTVAPVEVEEPVSDEKPVEDRPWVVIVWNDPINLMSYVTYVFQKLFGYSRDKATKLMLDVHHKGKAVVSSGPREKAELDVFRLHEHGLWATMQHD
jgi:ATP-dependent Clp protease adaptor protein ClpS